MRISLIAGPAIALALMALLFWLADRALHRPSSDPIRMPWSQHP